MTEPFEMRLCEQRHTILKPDTLYKFTADPTCPKCVELAFLSGVVSSAQIKPGGRWSPGPVMVHRKDGATVLVSRTDIHAKQRWWISLNSLEFKYD